VSARQYCKNAGSSPNVTYAHSFRMTSVYVKNDRIKVWYPRSFMLKKSVYHTSGTSVYHNFIQQPIFHPFQLVLVPVPVRRGTPLKTYNMFLQTSNGLHKIVIYFKKRMLHLIFLHKRHNPAFWTTSYDYVPTLILTICFQYPNPVVACLPRRSASLDSNGRLAGAVDYFCCSPSWPAS
jgi:hypothetical protein